jgi:hypothetical protein
MRGGVRSLEAFRTRGLTSRISGRVDVDLLSKCKLFEVRLRAPLNALVRRR